MKGDFIFPNMRYETQRKLRLIGYFVEDHPLAVFLFVVAVVSVSWALYRFFK